MHNFCSEAEARFIFEGFKYCSLWKVHFQLFHDFLAFFIWFVNCSMDFSATLSFSKLYKLSLWIIEHISEMFKNVSINLHLKPFSIAIFGKFYFYYLYHFRLFIWFANCKNLVYKLCITFWKCQDTQTLFILKCI